MNLVGFIIRIYHDTRSSECQINVTFLFNFTSPSQFMGVFHFWLRFSDVITILTARFTDMR